MDTIKQLTKEEIDKVWEYAKVDVNDNQCNPEEYRLDSLGDKIKKDEYGKETDEGWFVALFLSGEFIENNATKVADILLEPNVLIFSYKNYLDNLDSVPGKYKRYHSRYFGSSYQPYIISDSRIETLKSTYGISDEKINTYFSMRNSLH